MYTWCFLHSFLPLPACLVRPRTRLRSVCAALGRLVTERPLQWCFSGALPEPKMSFRNCRLQQYTKHDNPGMHPGQKAHSLFHTMMYIKPCRHSDNDFLRNSERTSETGSGVLADSAAGVSVDTGLRTSIAYGLVGSATNVTFCPKLGEATVMQQGVRPGRQ